MARNDTHNGDIEKLLAEIRKEGEPYSGGADDPPSDSRYWANFRVSVMDRIEANESRKPAALWRRAQEWLAEHVVGASIATSAAAFAIAMLVMVHPFSSEQSPVAVKQAPVATHPQIAQAPAE